MVEALRAGAPGGSWRLALAAGLALAAAGAAGAAAGGAAARGAGAPGKGLFEQLCVACHGPEGKGDGQAMRGIPVRPRNFADPAAMRDVTDQALFEAIQKGGAAVQKSPLMPPFGDQLKGAQIQELVAYIRSLAARAR